MQQTLSIDIETYSDVDLLKSGVAPYVESLNFEIMLFAYAFDDGQIVCVDLAKENLPKPVLDALTDQCVTKTAFNAAFEIACIQKQFNILLPLVQWDCTMVRSLMLGLPGSLEAVAQVLKLTEQKSTAGKALIRYFSKPCKPTKTNGLRARNLPKHNTEKWDEFIQYCIQDVRTERAVRDKLTKIDEIPSSERDMWVLDQQINQFGIKIDPLLVANAVECADAYQARLYAKAKTLTELDNPNSIAQLKGWLQEKLGIPIPSISKEEMQGLLDITNNSEAIESDKVNDVLRLRSEMAKTSVAKYSTMQEVCCRDGRLRGLLQYYGANRTGRWAGRLVQMHNLPQNKYKDLDLARNLLLERRYDEIELLFGSTPHVLSQLIRTAFVAPVGSRFLVADFSAIEARILAWVSDETWRLEVFRTHGKVYEASASQMFRVPMDEIGKDSPLRQKGKVAELALGYGGGTGALEQMGAISMGLQEGELQGLVDAWREANPNIKRFWATVNQAALKAVRNQTTIEVKHDIRFSCSRGLLRIRLPSGRSLCYVNPRISQGTKFGNDVVEYEGVNQTTKQWCKQETYGGKLTENIVQAIARDCLAYSMSNVAGHGYQIVLHVHDEIIAECPEGEGSLAGLCSIMGDNIPWAKGLILRADGYETPYYKKD